MCLFKCMCITCELLYIYVYYRPHWGKRHWATDKELKPVYERFDDFKKVRQEVDPKGMFRNEYLDTVLGL